MIAKFCSKHWLIVIITIKWHVQSRLRNGFVVENFNYVHNGDLQIIFEAAVSGTGFNVKSVDLNTTDEAGVLAAYLNITSYFGKIVDGIIGLREPACTVLPRVGAQTDVLVITHSCECSFNETTYIHLFPCAYDVGIALGVIMQNFSWTRAVIVAFDSTEYDYSTILQQAIRSKYSAINSVTVALFNSTQLINVKTAILSYKDSTRVFILSSNYPGEFIQGAYAAKLSLIDYAFIVYGKSAFDFSGFQVSSSIGVDANVLFTGVLNLVVFRIDILQQQNQLAASILEQVRSHENPVDVLLLYDAIRLWAQSVRNLSPTASHGFSAAKTLFGSTNTGATGNIVLDANGNRLADQYLFLIQPDLSAVAMYQYAHASDMLILLNTSVPWKKPADPICGWQYPTNTLPCPIPFMLTTWFLLVIVIMILVVIVLVITAICLFCPKIRQRKREVLIQKFTIRWPELSYPDDVSDHAEAHSLMSTPRVGSDGMPSAAGDSNYSTPVMSLTDINSSTNNRQWEKGVAVQCTNNDKRAIALPCNKSSRRGAREVISNNINNSRWGDRPVVCNVNNNNVACLLRASLLHNTNQNVYDPAESANSSDADSSHGVDLIRPSQLQSATDVTMPKFQIMIYKNIFVIVLRSLLGEIDMSDSKILKELRTVSVMDDENVNKFVGACIDQRHVSVVMMFASRGSLQDVLANKALSITDDFTLSFASDIAKGMRYLHDETRLGSHGHLTSTNCVIDDRWVCKITDYGLYYFLGKESRRKESLDHLESFLWTAPELLKLPIERWPHYGTKEGDVYAFGILLYEMATRGPPYASEMRDGKTVRVILQKVKEMNRPYFRPRVSQDTCSEPWRSLMELCWLQDPNKRPSFKDIKLAIWNMSDRKNTNIVQNMIVLVDKNVTHLGETVEEKTEELQEGKRQTEILLKRILPEKVANEMLAGQQAKPETFENITMLFSNIVDFSKIIYESSPEQIVAMLNKLFVLFDEATEKYDVYKVDTISDMYLAASGVPVLNGDRHYSEVATLSLHLMHCTTIYTIDHMPKRQLQLRIGIHSGPVVAGVIGMQRPKFSVYGDTINMTSRLMTSCYALRIQLSEKTATALMKTKEFIMDKRGEIEVKGKGKCTTYWLTGKKGFDYPMPDPAQALPIEEHEFK